MSIPCARIEPVPLPSDADHTGRDLGAEERALLREVIESGTLDCTKGSQVRAFERAVTARYGVPYAHAVTSGTAAIHMAIAAIDPEPGDEIITTPITDMGAIAPILYEQAVSLFADVDPVNKRCAPSRWSRPAPMGTPLSAGISRGRAGSASRKGSALARANGRRLCVQVDTTGQHASLI